MKIRKNVHSPVHTFMVISNMSWSTMCHWTQQATDTNYNWRIMSNYSTHSNVYSPVSLSRALEILLCFCFELPTHSLLCLFSLSIDMTARDRIVQSDGCEMSSQWNIIFILAGDMFFRALWTLCNSLVYTRTHITTYTFERYTRLLRCVQRTLDSLEWSEQIFSHINCYPSRADRQINRTSRWQQLHSSLTSLLNFMPLDGCSSYAASSRSTLPTAAE